MSREFDYEEHYHGADRKKYRKERRHAQESDRSKFKKTDQVKKNIIEVDPSWKKGKVVSITGEGIWVEADGNRFITTLKGLLKKERMESKNIIAVGDIVHFTEDHAIASIDPRYSFLARTDVSRKKEQLIAVNVDQAIIAISVVNPPLKPALVDRYLIAAEKGNIHPLIVINKIDLLDQATDDEKNRYMEFVSVYEKLGFPILSISTTTQIGIEALKSLLKNKTSVFSGQSGVGKSSLLNVAFGLELKTGEMSQKIAKGTHTTSTSELLTLPEGGYCVDTPGIRSFGIWKLQKDEVSAHFFDFKGLGCKYPDCLHINEPDCAVLKKLEEGKLAQIRYESYRSLIDEATGGADNWAKKKGNHEFD